uniref:Fibronectin type-III domain-containing protein n=1 Tax=candidate division WOR-3 bacterium TaxID=2052148 RepID=A0A7C4XLY4_UNCW3
MKRLMLGLIALGAIIIVGCGGEAERLAAPRITRVIMDHEAVEITWSPDSTVRNHGDFQGYYVFIATDSTDLLVDAETADDSLSPVNTTVLTDTTYTITGLADSLIYYIQVRTVNKDDKVGEYNANVPYVKASPRPEFTATVNFEIGQGPDQNCAIRFSDATLMADSAMANGGADMWVDHFGTAPDDTVAFDSPDHHQEYGTNARNTNFVNIGQYNLDEIYQVPTEPTQNYVGVAEGDLVIAKTQDGNYVKIHVDTIDKTNKTVTITYAYQDNPNFPYFAPKR